jgi:N-formylmaleamate deformylase
LSIRILEAQLEDRTILINGVRIRYQRFGNGRRPAVFLHGITDWGICWLRTAEALADLVDPILVDQRGHGLSEKPNDGYLFTDYASDAVALATALELAKPVIIGHSLGGGAGLLAAGMAPARWGGLIAVDPASGFLRTPQPRRRLSEFLTRQRNFRRLSRAQIFDIYAEQHPDWAIEERERTIAGKVHVVDQVLDSIGMPAGFDVEGCLRNIECPTLVIRADDRLSQTCTRETGEWLRSLSSQVRVTMIEGAGHNVQRERFEEMVAACRAFLAPLQA